MGLTQLRVTRLFYFFRYDPSLPIFPIFPIIPSFFIFHFFLPFRPNLTDMSNSSRPKVIIVGAGIGGLTLGILLEKAGVPFEIVERSASTTPMGTSATIP